MLDSLLAGVMLFSSFAARTPNVQPNPDDYEVSLGFSHKYIHVNRQWERELGSFYVDDLVWAKLEDGVYFKPEYMNKESRDVRYLKLDWRRSYGGITVGATTRSTDTKLRNYDTFASIGYTNKKTYWEKVDVEFSFDGYLPPDDSGETELKNFEFENKFKTSWKLTDKIRLYNLGEISKLKGNQFYKAKIGIEYVF